MSKPVQSQVEKIENVVPGTDLRTCPNCQMKTMVPSSGGKGICRACGFIST